MSEPKLIMVHTIKSNSEAPTLYSVLLIEL